MYYGIAQFTGAIKAVDAISILSADFKHVNIKSIDVAVLRFKGKINSHRKDIISIIEFTHSSAAEDKEGDEDVCKISLSLSFL